MIFNSIQSTSLPVSQPSKKSDIRHMHISLIAMDEKKKPLWQKQKSEWPDADRIVVVVECIKKEEKCCFFRGEGG